MQVTRPNEIWRPGVRLHPKACAALKLEAERATPKRLGTLVPRTCMHAFGTGYARKSGEPLGFRPKEGTCASTGAQPSRRDKPVTLAAISPPGVARGRFVWGQQSGLAGSKPPPLFTRGARGDARGKHGAPLHDRVHLPTYLPIYIYIYTYIYIYMYICIHYYTPLPSNVANKQASSNKQQGSKQQTLLLSVLAIAPPRRPGLYSTLAIIKPR